MLLVFHGLKGIAPLPRMLFRSSHIYILLTSLINLALGFDFSTSGYKGRQSLRNIGSILILIAPFLMTTAFFVEPGLASFERPFAGPGVYTIFAGMMLYLISNLGKKDQPA